MKIKAMIAVCFLSVGSASASNGTPEIDVKVTSLSNLANSTAIEVCGTAVDKSGAKPLLVTMRHGNAEYTTLTNGAGNWCTVIKRWTFDGQVDVTAATFNNPGETGGQTFFRIR